MLACAADLLTLFRGLVALWLVWLGATRGASALPMAVTITLIAWVGDSLDGWLARRARRPTLLGRYDFLVDVLLTWGALLYITLSGFLPMWVTAVYTLLAGVAVAALQRKAVLVLFMRPVDLTCGVVALTGAPEVRWMIAATLAGLAVAQRQRLRTRLPRWLCEVAQMLHLSWLVEWIRRHRARR
ncbi:MAG TPA: hypothetical protein G4O02_04370 [Caldilineae bacterium]|nr:hypothetical protein [Caldilineae bacterium]